MLHNHFFQAVETVAKIYRQMETISDDPSRQFGMSEDFLNLLALKYGMLATEQLKTQIGKNLKDK